MATALQYQDLAGLVATETKLRQKSGDNRDRSDIADDILREVGAPDLKPAIGRLTRAIADRSRCSGNPPSRVLP